MSESVLTDKQKFWLDHIERHAESNMSRTAYCKKHKLNVEHMAHFDRYLRSSRPDLFSESKESGQFVGVKTTKQTIRLNLSNGVSVDVPASPRLVAEVIRALL